MYKVALIIVSFLLVVLASTPEAHAATTNTAETGSKVRGKLVTNPDKQGKAFSAQKLSDPASAAISGPAASVYSVWFDWIGDTDGDGYYHQFDVNFDIDTVFSSQRVYVIAELSGSTSQILFQTEAYTLTGASGDDSYQARALLTA